MKTTIINKVSTPVLVFLALIIFGATNFTAAPGDLDLKFGNGGIVVTSGIGGRRVNFASAMAIQSDGKIVAVGSGFISGPGSTWDVAVVRYNTDGSLDSSFGNSGIVLTDLSNSHNGASSVAIQLNGKIVVAGGSPSTSGGTDFMVIRYNTDGSLDSSFNGTGIVTTALGFSRSYASSVAIGPDGKIAAAGYSYSGMTNDIAVVRYNTNGQLDASFNGGYVITPVGNSSDTASSVAVQDDGKIVAGGLSGNDVAGANFAVVRYTISGQLDTSFNGNGKVITSFGNASSAAAALAIQSDGKIVAAGQSVGNMDIGNDDFAFVRYHPNGSLDASFGGMGKVIVPVGNSYDSAHSVAIQPNGKIIAAGRSGIGANSELSLVRLNSNGSLDTTFNGTGKVITNTAGNRSSSVALQSDGKIVAAGDYDDDIVGIVLVRYQGDPPRANGKIAFTSDRDGNREIYLMEADGTNQFRITNNSVVDDHPTWSPDGTKIAFISETSPGRYSIFRMNADGTARTEITPLISDPTLTNFLRLEYSMSWSPDGGRITYQDAWDIFVVDLNTGFRHNLTSDGENMPDFHPSWSPDGSTILFSRSPQGCRAIYGIDPNGTNLRVVLSSNHCIAYSPSWSADGSRFSFVDAEYFEKAPPVSQIRTAKANGTDVVVFDGGFPDLNMRDFPRWSPDGRTIVFQRRDFVTNDIELHSKTVDGSIIAQLTDTTGSNFHPSWQSINAVSVSGRATVPGGNGLPNAVVSITGSLGFARTATTSTFGYYSFDNIPTGGSYTISVASRRYRFLPRTLTIADNLADIDFAGQE